MSKNNLWYFGVLILTFGIVLTLPYMYSFIIWFIILLIVSGITSSSGIDLENKFNIMILSIVVAVGISIYVTTEYPYKRNIHEKIYVPNSYTYLNGRLYIDTKSPKSMLDISNNISDKQLAYMNINECQPVRVDTTFKYWVISKTTTHNWICMKDVLNDN